MEISILQLVEGAKKATGLTVVIDVFRAFSLEPYLFSQGVSKIYPVGDIQMAYSLKSENPDFILIGERNEQMPEGFDLGNSPIVAQNFDLKEKEVIHTTSAGTQGIVNAKNADLVVTGSFVNAGAIVKYIKAQNPSNVSLCCMGYSALRPTEEDTLCAEYIKACLENKDSDFDEIVRVLRKTSGQRFFVPERQSFAPKEDFYLCTKLSIFNFVLAVSKENGRPVITRVDV